jgi:hypothetical protein
MKKIVKATCVPYLFSRSATDGLYAMYNWEGGKNVLLLLKVVDVINPSLSHTSGFLPPLLTFGK